MEGSLDSRQPTSSRPVPLIARIFATISLLVAGWWLMPMRIEQLSLMPSSEECLTLADQAPTPGSAALTSLERCAVLLPDDVEILGDLGAEYEAAGRVGEAEAVYRRALERDPEYADLHRRLAGILLKRQALAEARTHVQAALELQPNRQALIDLLAEISGQAAEGWR